MRVSFRAGVGDKSNLNLLLDAVVWPLEELPELMTEDL